MQTYDAVSAAAAVPVAVRRCLLFVRHVTIVTGRLQRIILRVRVVVVLEYPYWLDIVYWNMEYSYCLDICTGISLLAGYFYSNILTDWILCAAFHAGEKSLPLENGVPFFFERQHPLFEVVRFFQIPHLARQVINARDGTLNKTGDGGCKRQTSHPFLPSFLPSLVFNGEMKNDENLKVESKHAQHNEGHGIENEGL
jgi:hypothetical protein